MNRAAGHGLAPPAAAFRLAHAGRLLGQDPLGLRSELHARNMPFTFRARHATHRARRPAAPNMKIVSDLTRHLADWRGDPAAFARTSRIVVVSSRGVKHRMLAPRGLRGTEKTAQSARFAAVRSTRDWLHARGVAKVRQGVQRYRNAGARTRRSRAAAMRLQTSWRRRR